MRPSGMHHYDSIHEDINRTPNQVFFWQEPIPTAASSSHGKLTSATSTGGSLARTTAPPSRLPSLPDYGNDSLHSNSSSQPVGKRLVASQNDKSKKSKVVVVTDRMTDTLG